MTAFFSYLRRAWLGVWRSIDLARRVVLNLVFFGVLLLVYLALQPELPIRVEPDSTLLIRPSGAIVEQFSGSPLDRAWRDATDQAQNETRLRDLLLALERAAGDEQITQVVLDTRALMSVGIAALKEIEQAMMTFKQSGKPVIALAATLGQQQYYLAALADEIWLDPNGLVWIDGYANYRSFYREGLEKLEVEINLFRVGEYKSAMEPFIRDDMSDEAKEAAEYWLGGLWQQYLEGISRLRGMPLEILNQVILEFPQAVTARNGDFAELALQQGLVDELVTDPEARQRLASMGAPDAVGDGFRAIGVEEYLLATKSMDDSAKRKGVVAVVVAEGEILNGQQPPGVIGSESLAQQLRRVARDEEIDALVLRVNSPGGDAFASEVIRRELQAVRDQGKTVLVSMGDVAASGGYWISMGAEEVWASPASITGSIGVFGMLPTFAGTLDKMGVHADGVGTTPLAGKMRLDIPLDPSLRDIFQAATENIYSEFITLVAGSRSMSAEAVDEVARGRVWSGWQAADRGLVDRTGTLRDTVDAAARRAGMTGEYRVTYVEPLLSSLDQLVLDFTSKALRLVELETAQRDSWSLPSPLQDILRDLRALQAQSGQFTVAAHCLCRVN